MLLRAGLLYSELYISVYIKCVCWRQRGQSCQADSSARFLRATHILRALLDMKSITIVSCWNKSIHSVPSVLYSVSQLYRIMYISNTRNTKAWSVLNRNSGCRHLQCQSVCLPDVNSWKRERFWRSGGTDVFSLEEYQLNLHWFTAAYDQSSLPTIYTESSHGFYKSALITAQKLLLHINGSPEKKYWFIHSTTILSWPK